MRCQALLAAFLERVFRLEKDPKNFAISVIVSPSQAAPAGGEPRNRTFVKWNLDIQRTRAYNSCRNLELSQSHRQAVWRAPPR